MLRKNLDHGEDMTVAEVKKKKNVLEDAIRLLIIDFVRKTGCHVTGLRLDLIDCSTHADNVSSLYEVSTTIEVAP